MYRELSKEERTELFRIDPYVIYRCTTDLMGEIADPPYRPVMDTEKKHPDIRYRVVYFRGELPKE